MITGNQCTTDLYNLLKEKLQEAASSEASEEWAWLDSVRVFKDDDRPASYKGFYIAVNCLPFVYGKVLNSQNVANVNLHAPKLSDGTADRIALNQMLAFISGFIPMESELEEEHGLYLNGVYYVIHSVSRPMDDVDETYLTNVRLSLTFNAL